MTKFVVSPGLPQRGKFMHPSSLYSRTARRDTSYGSQCVLLQQELRPPGDRGWCLALQSESHGSGTFYSAGATLKSDGRAYLLLPGEFYLHVENYKESFIS